MQKLLNLEVKYRESFRRFAPSVLREQVSAWFDALAVENCWLEKDEQDVALKRRYEDAFDLD